MPTISGYVPQTWLRAVDTLARDVGRPRADLIRQELFDLLVYMEENPEVSSSRNTYHNPTKDRLVLVTITVTPQVDFWAKRLAGTRALDFLESYGPSNRSTLVRAAVGRITEKMFENARYRNMFLFVESTQDNVTILSEEEF